VEKEWKASLDEQQPAQPYEGNEVVLMADPSESWHLLTPRNETL